MLKYGLSWIQVAEGPFRGASLWEIVAECMKEFTFSRTIMFASLL